MAFFALVPYDKWRKKDSTAGERKELILLMSAGNPFQ